ncbi:alpha/beta fold hydrolase [Enemella sp. A6]|uniref:alpha/beta fold hydrolase n=1 Tax=Enemella sp. A6 TaxID=3440152 RepID=UPI003EBC924A
MIRHHQIEVGPPARIAHVAEWAAEAPDAPVLVIWSGLGGAWFDWVPVAARLPEVRILVIDRPGNGDAPDWPPGTHDLEQVVADAGTILDSLGVSAAVFAGHSMGGWYAEAAAAGHRSRAVGVILLDASPAADRHRPPGRLTRRIRYTQTRFAMALLDLAAGLIGWRRLGPWLRKALEGPGPHPGPERDLHRQRCRHTYRRRGLWQAALVEWAAYPTLRAQLGELRHARPLGEVPLLNVTARWYRPGTDTAEHRPVHRTHRGNTARVRVQPAPHMLMLTHPDTVAVLFRQTLDLSPDVP